MPLFYQHKLTLGKRLCEGFVKTDAAAGYGFLKLTSDKPLNRQARKVREENPEMLDARDQGPPQILLEVLK
jgi:hypothetical protein